MNVGALLQVPSLTFWDPHVAPCSIVRVGSVDDGYGWHIAEGRADIFLAYCTATRETQRQSPDLQIVELPDNLAVGADYGLTVMTGASSAAERFAQFIISPAGQKILIGHGFAPGQTER